MRNKIIIDNMNSTLKINSPVNAGFSAFFSAIKRPIKLSIVRPLTINVVLDIKPKFCPNEGIDNNKLKKLLLSTALCSFASLSQAADIETNTARFQAMNKITGQVREIDVSVNGLANFETFSILVRKCVTKSPEETPENTDFSRGFK